MTRPPAATATGIAAALLCFAGAAGAQFTLTGDGCVGDSGTPATIEGSGFPTVGQTYSIEIFGLPNTAVIAAYGLTPLIPGIDLTGVGLPGCVISLLSDGTALGVTDGDGVASFPAPSPPAGGITLYVQGYVADIGVTTFGATTELLSFTTLPASAFSGGEVITTEFMRDPSGISDGDGEWIEIYNTTGGPIDIEGWYLADDDTDLHQIDTGGSGLIVPAGTYAVLGANADTLVSGVTLDYEWSGFFLSNSTTSGGDEIRLLDPVGFEVDRLKYSVPDGWPLAASDSTRLDAGSLDGVSNDDPANWCLDVASVYEAIFGINSGTPGSDNGTCPKGPEVEVGDIIVTEFMANPGALFDSEGEYFELYNTTESPIDIEGWTLACNSGSHVVDTSGSGLIVPAGEYIAIGVTNLATVPAPDYVFDFQLGNSGDEIVVRDASSTLHDIVDYDPWSGFTVSGISAILAPSVSQDATSNNDVLNWCLSSSLGVGTGDFGTPGEPNDPCTKEE